MLEPLYGRHALFHWFKRNRQGFLALLRYLFARINGWEVYLCVDGAQWLKGNEVGDLLNEHPEIQMEHPLPYHPELNVQERV